MSMSHLESDKSTTANIRVCRSVNEYLGVLNSHLKNDQSTTANNWIMSINQLEHNQSTTANNRSMSVRNLENDLPPLQ